MKEYMNKIMANQLKKPSGFLGKIIAKKITEGNSPTYDWMISIMDFSQCRNILEIGYGTGKVLNHIAVNYPSVNLFGVDFSELMYKKALQNNMEFVTAGKILLSKGDILDYAAPVSFDLIFGINVIYFWDDLKLYAEKIKTLLQPKGKVCLYMTDREVLQKMPATMTNVFNKRTIEEVIRLFESCGYSEVYSKTGEYKSKKGHCLIAVK